ncbi:enoyl-CoA hydratase/isomerase family protein [Jatrophihabitans sp. DSM 45814]
MAITVSVEADVAHVVLDAPGRLNASDLADWRALHAAIVELSEAAGLRGLVVRGAGEAFCAGADLGLLDDLRAMDEPARRDVLALAADMVLRLTRFPLPTVAVVDGACFGGGTSIAMACDRIVSTSRAKFGFVFTGLGLPAGDMLCSWLLCRRIGTRKAWPILETAGVVTAEQALSLGLVDEISTGSAAEISSGLRWSTSAPGAVRTTKQQILRIERAFGELDDLVRTQVDELTRAVGGPEFAEGLASLQQRRKPNYG